MILVLQGNRSEVWNLLNINCRENATLSIHYSSVNIIFIHKFKTIIKGRWNVVDMYAISNLTSESRITEVRLSIGRAVAIQSIVNLCVTGIRCKNTMVENYFANVCRSHAHYTTQFSLNNFRILVALFYAIE